METLYELVNVVNRKRLSKIDVLDKTFLNSKSKSLYYKFYHAIERKEIKSDDEASKLLYGTSKEDPRYRMLKSRFKNKVLKTLVLLNVEDAFENEIHKKVYYECMINYLAIETIIKITGTNNLAYTVIKENYSKAEKYNFYDILKNYSYHLMLYYSLKGDKRAFFLEEKKYYKYSDLANKEQSGKHIYNKIIINFVGGTSITTELLDTVRNYISDLRIIKEEINNAEISFYYFYSSLLYYENVNDLNKILEICKEAEDLLKNQPHIITSTRKIAILLYRMKAFLHSRMYKNGINLLHTYTNKNLQESNYNWFVLKEFEFKLYLQDNKIDDATRVYQQVIKNKFLKRQVEQLTEKWKIFNAYLIFMDSYINKGNFKFSLSKFLNDVPVNSKDKSGYNFAIRVIEMMFMFARKEYNFVFQKMEALRVYRTRYLTDNTYKRNHLFLSVLLKAEKTGFRGREMQKADWPELHELRQQNNHIIADWEIIPYEVLWDIIVELARQ